MQPNSQPGARRVGAIGRGATASPPNRFETIHAEEDLEHLAADEAALLEPSKLATQFLPDKSRTLIRENDSPDIPFRYSINPYRGCEHGCAYCYARPTHETLGMNAGLDFETKILVKYEAAGLLRKELNRKNWQSEVIAMAGVTDCYQPAERTFRLTRGLLEVMIEAKQAVALVTKNALIVRDADLLEELARQQLVHAAISVTTLDAELARTLEPRTATPAARLRAIGELSARRIPVRVIVAPIIPGLNDHEIPQILQAAKQAGALAASYVMLRLPQTVAPIFTDWLQTHRPLAASRIKGLIREMRQGKLNDANFGSRMKGSGPYAEGIRTTFELFAKKLGLNQVWPTFNTSLFRPPHLPGGQLKLF